MVGGPTLPVAGIFCQEFQLAGVEVKAVGVEGFGVAAVQADDDFSRHVLKVVDDGGTHTGKVGVGAQIAPIEAHSEEVVVFVAAFVFGEDNSVVVGPHIAADAAGCLEGELAGSTKMGSFVDGLHEHVHATFIGSEKGEMTPIGRNLVGGLFGVAEEVFEWEHNKKRD